MAYSNWLVDSITTEATPPTAISLENETVTETGDGATLAIDSNSDLGTLYSYSKTTAFTGTEAEKAAEIMANGLPQVPVLGTNTRVVTGQDTLTDYYAGWVQDSDANMPPFLPFGSGDASVVCEHSLTTGVDDIAAYMVSLGATASAPSGSPVFDAVKGVNVMGGYLRYNSLDSALAGMTDNGQISFEIEANVVSANNPLRGSNGTGAVGTESVIDLQRTVAGTSVNVQVLSQDIYPRASGKVVGILDGLTTINDVATPAAPMLNKLALGDFVRLSIGWETVVDNVVFYFAFDGVPITTATIDKTEFDASGPFGNRLFIGSYSGANNLQDSYIRNLTISTKAPAFASSKRVAFFSDSMVRNPRPRYEGEYSHIHSYTYLQEAYRNGDSIHPSGMAVVRLPGAYISEQAVKSMSDILPDLASASPEVVYLTAGSNDCIAVALPTDFESSLDSLIASIQALPSVEKLILVTVRSFQGSTGADTTAAKANRDAANAIYASKGLPVVDAFTLLGGDGTPPDYCYEGQITGAYDDIHIDIGATLLEGPAYYKADK